MKSIKRDEQGITHLLVVVLIVLVVAVVGFTGYEVVSKNKSNSNSSSSGSSSSTSGSGTASSSTVAASCLATYHDANLCHFAAYSDMSKVAYKATLKTTDPQGSVTNLTFESDGKGNSTLSGTGNGASMNSIILDGKTYVQDPSSGVWVEYTGATAPTQTDNPTSSMDFTVGNAGVNFKPEGKVACGSYTCYKYTVSVATMGGASQTVLFDTSSYRLREWDYSSSQGSTVMTVDYPSINITAPSPVQQLNVGQ
jgi:hypothetical protein